MLLTEIPLDPDVDDARGWLLDEVGKSEYQAARPNWFDRLAESFWEWLQGLRGPSGLDGNWLIPLLILLGVLLLIVIAFIVFGRPRLGARSRRAQALFDDGPVLSAGALRKAAAAAAAAGDWQLAVQEAFRALARGLDERTLISLTPGTTAQGVGRRARSVFPQHAAALDEAANRFDAIRYLDRQAVRADYERMSQLDAALQAEPAASRQQSAAAHQAASPQQSTTGSGNSTGGEA